MIRRGKFLLLAVAAIAAAAGLAHVAYYDFGLSTRAVRADALLSAAGLGGFLVLFSYSEHFRKRR